MCLRKHSTLQRLDTLNIMGVGWLPVLNSHKVNCITVNCITKIREGNY